LSILASSWWMFELPVEGDEQDQSRLQRHHPSTWKSYRSQKWISRVRGSDLS
jgi:hypothetical protein